MNFSKRLLMVLCLIALLALSACVETPPDPAIVAGVDAARTSAATGTFFQMFETALRDGQFTYRVFYNQYSFDYMILATTKNGETFMVHVVKDLQTRLNLAQVFGHYGKPEYAVESMIRMGYEELAESQWPKYLAVALQSVKDVVSLTVALSQAEFMPFIVILTPEMMECLYPVGCTQDL